MGAPSPSEDRRDRLVFYPVAVVGVMFCVTVLISIALLFDDPKAPLHQWFDRHLTNLLLLEAALLVTIGLLAMFIDRVRTLRRIQAERDAAEWEGRPTNPHAEEPTRVD